MHLFMGNDFISTVKQPYTFFFEDFSELNGAITPGAACLPKTKTFVAIVNLY